MLLEYNEENLKRVSAAIKNNLTIDLIPKKMRHRNIFGNTNGTYGHCHTVCGVLQKIFGSKIISVWRSQDDEGLYHWWAVDKDGKIIDLTADQYTLNGKVPPYETGQKTVLLGYYRNKRKVSILLERVKAELKLECTTTLF